MKEHEYRRIPAGIHNNIMATPLVTKGFVTIVSNDDHAMLDPDRSMDLAFMTLCAAQEADPEHWDERWEGFKEQVRKAFGE